MLFVILVSALGVFVTGVTVGMLIGYTLSDKAHREHARMQRHVTRYYDVPRVRL